MSLLTNKSIGFVISHTANLLNSSINKKIIPLGIAIEQRAILELIMDNEEIKQGDLAKLLGKDKTTISRTLKTLEDKKYIIRKNINNKTYMVKLSHEGYKVIKDTENEVTNFRQKLLNKLNEEEINNLYKYLEIICKDIDQ